MNQRASRCTSKYIIPERQLRMGAEIEGVKRKSGVFLTTIGEISMHCAIAARRLHNMLPVVQLEVPFSSTILVRVFGGGR